jgi:hypothetical protein
VHAGTLWLGNAAYLYLSVSFIQMLKALMPVAVFATGCSFGIETFSTSTFVNMVCAPLLSTDSSPLHYSRDADTLWKCF